MHIFEKKRCPRGCNGSTSIFRKPMASTGQNSKVASVLEESRGSKNRYTEPMSRENRQNDHGVPPTGKAAPIADNVNGVIREALRGRARGLSDSERAYFEPRFGLDFGGVRLHEDSSADRAARQISARAFTVGNHIVFRSGLSGGSSVGKRRLLAHELAHVAQRTGRIQREFAIAPTHRAIDGPQLDEDQIRDAIRYNSLRYFDASEIELLRDVLGVSPTPAVIDREFVLAVASYQQQYGETIDGKLGRNSAAALTRELTAESETAGARELGIRGRAIQRVRNVDSGGKSDIFDAMLDHANARLTLVMRVQFNFVAGAAGAWPSAAAQTAWQNSFIRLVQRRWSYKLLMSRRNPSNRYLRYYATRVSVIPSNASPHYTANVSYETSHTGSSVSGGSNTATLDALDVNQISYTFGAHTYRRTTSGHEFGHMLGLDHIACNNNSAACYGTTHGDRRNIMGYGGDVTTRNAAPFLDAMRAITGMAWDAAPFRTLR